MAIITSNGEFRSGPRIIDIKDTRTGCPGTAANGTTLTSASVTVRSTAIYWAHARVIMNAASAAKQRADMSIRLNGVSLKTALETVTNSSNANVSAWEELNASHMGTIESGTHIFSMVGENASNCWGCGSTWGEISIMIWESS